MVPEETQGHVYLVKVEIVNGERRDKWIGNVEVIEQVMDSVKRRSPRPYYRPCDEGKELGVGGVVRPPGFEPGIAGLEGRRPSPG